MASGPRHSVLADTSSLIAVANTEQWDILKNRLNLTTTNVCKHELKNHVDSNIYSPEGSREYYLKQGSQRVLDHLDDDDSPWSCVTVVPRPHGPDAGEESLKQELSEHPEPYQIISLLDSTARQSIRRLISERQYDIDVVGPPYLLFILLDNDLISKMEFCEATIKMIRMEGWTGYEVVKNAWSNIPVDCTDILDDENNAIFPPD